MVELVSGPSHWTDVAELLSPDECRELSGIRDPEHASIKAAVTVALRRLLGLTATTPRIETLPSGRPSVPGRPWSLSTSHKGRRAVVAASRDADLSIGVDLELLDAAIDHDTFVRYALTDHEMHTTRWRIAEAMNVSGDAAVTVLWSAKEALAKSMDYPLRPKHFELELPVADRGLRMSSGAIALSRRQIPADAIDLTCELVEGGYVCTVATVRSSEAAGIFR
jgi:hypothetical protein